MSLESKQKEYSRKIIEEIDLNLTNLKKERIQISRGFIEKIISELKQPTDYRNILIQQLELLKESDVKRIKIKNSQL